MSILSRIFGKKFIKHEVPFRERTIERKLIDVPDEQEIICKIESPQFFMDGYNYYMFQQKGIFNKATMLFTPFDNTFFEDIFRHILGGMSPHEVQFHDINDLKKALLKVF